jgi:hypothetical protein
MAYGSFGQSRFSVYSSSLLELVLGTPVNGDMPSTVRDVSAFPSVSKCSISSLQISVDDTWKVPTPLTCDYRLFSDDLEVPDSTDRPESLSGRMEEGD